MGSDDLVTWLRARLDEDQWFAEELSRGGNGGHITWAISRGRSVWMCTDYRRMLAEVEAKRRILDLHTGFGHDCVFAIESAAIHGYGDHENPEYGPCDTVKLLAPPYAANPGFREEWRV